MYIHDGDILLTEGGLVRISLDDYAENPRDFYDHMFNFITFAKYRDIDFNEFKTIDDFFKEMKTSDYIVFNMYLDGYGTISLENFSEFKYSGETFAYVSKDFIRKEYSVKKITSKILDKVKSVLESEIEEYNYYISGETYFVEYGKDFEECFGGIYGSDINYNGLIGEFGEIFVNLDASYTHYHLDFLDEIKEYSYYEEFLSKKFKIKDYDEIIEISDGVNSEMYSKKVFFDEVFEENIEENKSSFIKSLKENIASVIKEKAKR